MFQLQFVIGLFIGLQFNILHKVLNAPINIENESKVDFYAADSRSLFDKPDREADAYDESELDNLFINPDEMGPYFEGDIFIPNDLMFKSAFDAPKLWPNGVVPVQINPSFTAFQTNQTMIALRELTVKTSLRFPMRTEEEDYVYITDEGYGCFSRVGHIGGRQVVNLENPRCFVKLGIIIHELLHAVGFFHEQSRNDRDDHVIIRWENIMEDYKFNFEMRMEKIDPSVDFTYDYASVMHYGRYSSGFAIDANKETISPLFNTTDAFLMGQRVGLSPLDIRKVNAKYPSNTSEQNQIDDLYSISFQFTSGNISLDLKYNASDFNNE